jgi:hypothetical protein
MFGRLSAILATVRPRTLARTVKAVEDLLAANRDLKRTVRQLEDSVLKTDGRLAALETEARSLKVAVADAHHRESRLTAIYRCDVEQQPMLAALDRVLSPDAIAAHVERAAAAADLHLDPFPHVVLENLFPQPFYDAVVRGIPPSELFDGAENKQRIVVPFEMAPAFSRQVWSFLLHDVVDAALGPALLRKLREPLAEWVTETWPELAGQPIESVVRMQSTDGRILLRRRGYVIPPHRDPKWGFVTCLLYLARPGDSQSWGTQLYAVDDDTEAASVAPHWIRAERCRLVKDVPFRANTALVFLNSRGAHGAQIPASAEPPTLERYIYQFRIGPTAESIRRLVALLPAERREKWAGKVADYA